MLGFRGCRLGIGYPEITEMQARAIFEAAATCQKEGIKVEPEIMIPLVGFKKELDLQVEVVHRVAARGAWPRQKVKLNYLVGTMIEVPRGALTADEIAQTAEFFSFGTNDLTQTGLGMSRDDSGSFLPHYQRARDRQEEPVRDDRRRPASASSCEIAVEKGRETRPGHQARHLRRARRRPGVDPLLRQGRARLRELLAVPRAGRAAGGGAGGARQVRGRGLITDLRARRRGHPDRSTGWTRAWLAAGERRLRSGSTSISPTPDEARDPHATSFTSTSSRSKTRSASCTIPRSSPTTTTST